jgi:2-keto-3-deoxy-L-rhamnonate aldolase RhmA
MAYRNYRFEIETDAGYSSIIVREEHPFDALDAAEVILTKQYFRNGFRIITDAKCAKVMRRMPKVIVEVDSGICKVAQVEAAWLVF